jgi:hypothetical protein
VLRAANRTLSTLLLGVLVVIHGLKLDAFVKQDQQPQAAVVVAVVEEEAEEENLSATVSERVIENVTEIEIENWSSIFQYDQENRSENGNETVVENETLLVPLPLVMASVLAI